MCRWPLLVALLVCCQSCVSGGSPQKRADSDWADTNYAVALDRLLPLPPEQGVACRVFRDLYHENLEYRIEMSLAADGDVSAVRIVRPMKDSIWTQLRRLHRRDRSLPVANFLPRIDLGSERHSVSTCPQLSEVLPFSAVRSSFTEPSQVITLHPWVRECATEETVFPVVTDDDHAIARWLDDIINRVGDC